MRFSLIPRELKFFDMFDQAAVIITRAATKFLEMVTKFDRLAERSNELKEEEHAGDEVIGRIIKALDRSFITPFDREDIHTLASSLDDVLDNMEQAIRLCRTMKQPEEIQKHLREIGRLENEADKIYRDSESALFANPPDIMLLIKWRELYSWLEETVDACKDVAQVISEIVIKGS
jgi:uncharacterized protein Yka (UPF0111/DUF47 family)